MERVRECARTPRLRRPDTEWFPGVLLPAVSRPSYGIRSASSVSHRRGSTPLWPFYPARPSPCESFRVANWQMRRVYLPQAVLRRYCPKGALLRGVSTRGKSPRKSACEVIMGSTMSSYLDRKRPLPLSKSLPRAAYRTAVRSFLLYHIWMIKQALWHLFHLLFNLFMV